MAVDTTEARAGASKPAALQARTLCEAFQTTAAERADEVALRHFGTETQITWAEYAARVRAIAGGLHTLGVRRGDTVALMLANRPEFNLVDTAAFHLGATPFSVYNTSSVEQVAYVFSNAQNAVVVTERQFVDVVRRARAELEGVRHVILVDGEGDDEDALTLAGLQATDPGPDFDFEAAWRAVEPDDVLTLIYTSGTTGPPKGVQTTHHNMMSEVRGVDAVLPMSVGGRIPSFLPAAHIADRWSAYYHCCLIFGCTVTAVSDPRQIAAALPEVRPTVWGAVPRIWEKLMAALQAGGVTDPASMPAEARAAVRERIGLGSVEWLVSGAAAIPGEVLQFYLDLGLPVCELWGMSETSCCAVINPPEDIRIGTVGKPIPGVELRLLDDGELLVRGDIVMKGYRGDPEKTREAIDDDGWVHTGDIARIDGDGYVTIVDRKKELIINAAGKNMSPVNIEQKLKASSPLIGQAVCIGDRRPYNVALLTLDPDAAAAFAAAHDCSPEPAQLREREDVRAEVQRGVDAANAQLSRVEQIKRHRILDVDWAPGQDELTPTMKLRRKPIHAKYAEEIEALYA